MSVEDSLEQVNWLEKEKAELADREASLDKRQKELEKLDRDVTKKLTTLEQAESSRIAQLARLYDGMDARAVAKLAANLDDATVVAILPRMKPKNASQVLALLPAKRAAKLSKQMITIAGN
jgi:flagellar motility protein MotE (MotC chaperone)